MGGIAALLPATAKAFRATAGFAPTSAETSRSSFQRSKVDSCWSLPRTEFTPHHDAGMRGRNDNEHRASSSAISKNNQSSIFDNI